MRWRISWVGILWRLIIALTLALCLVLTNSNSVAALSLDDYFVYSYDVEFSKSQIKESEVFYTTVEAEATCKNDLPVSVSEASITGRIIAEYQASGAKVTLNSSYTITIKPFPSKKGETAQSSVVVPLQFPQGSQSGTYSIIGELIEAKVKKAVFWIPVTAFLPSSQTVGSVTYTSSSRGAGAGAGAGGAPPPGTTYVSDFVRDDGTFIETVVAKSFDGKCELIINKGTRGLRREGSRLTKITITEMEDWLAPPENSKIIGVIYNLGPDDATFDPPITLTITYDELAIPEGVAEDNLVIAMWDEKVGEWIMLNDCTVDPKSSTISAPVGHFTAFAILTYIRPTTFTASELSITPANVAIGEEVTISALITNTGDLAGSHEVILKIDNVVAATKEVTLEGDVSEEVTFITTQDVAGNYTVTVDGLSGTFVVRGPTTFAISKLSITPAEVAIGEEVTIGALITNTGDLAGSYKATLKLNNVVVATKEVTLEGGVSEEVTFTVAKHSAGTYTVTVDGISGTFVVRRPAVFAASELSITPAEVAIGEEVTISALITNTGDLAGSHEVILKIDNVVAATKEVTLEGDVSEEVAFITTQDVAGNYTVTVDGLSGAFMVRGPPTINWYLLGGIIAACIVTVLVISVIAVFRWRRA